MAALTLSWKAGFLTVAGDFFRRLSAIEGIEIQGIAINYLEAYCRPGSTGRVWTETVIPHQTEPVAAAADGSFLELRDTLADGVTVTHRIRAGIDAVDFHLEAENPTPVPSQADWAQPCIRVGAFTGHSENSDPYAYIQRCFLFLGGELVRMPTPDWAVEAIYTPGQVWVPEGISRADVNPRPLNPHSPTSGLIGCYSAGGTALLATAWEPYQELFQGVIQCIHSDFRIGGLQPGERKTIRGKLYLLPNDIPLLLRRYAEDFPGQR